MVYSDAVFCCPVLYIHADSLVVRSQNSFAT